MLPPNRKVLILTAGFGEGHNTAARSVRAAVEQIGQGHAEARVLDLFEMCHGRMNDFSRKAYLMAINRTPKIWQKIYEALDKTTMLEATLFTLSGMKRRLARIIEDERPDAIVSTYPVYSFLLDRIRFDEKRFVLTTVVTDSITINSAWYRAPSDYFLVPNEDTARVMKAAGVPEAKIRVLGFPVTPRFATRDITRGEPSNASQRRVLFMINFGGGTAPELLRQLLAIPDISLTVTVGRDAALHTRIAETARRANRQVEIFGWTDRMPELLMSHHLLISKAGGATVQETTAAETPMIISKVVPGQEEGNAQLLTENGCGRVAPSHEEIVGAVREVFADNARLWYKWHANIAKLSRPRAALDIAQFVLLDHQMIRAIIFDIGNVILRFDFGIAMHRLAHQSDPVSEEIKGRLGALQTSYETGHLTRPEFQREAIEAIRFTGEEREFVQAWEEIFDENLPMTDLIRRLHPKYPLYLLSNTSDLHVDYFQRTYPVFKLFKDAVYSYRVKAFKPDPAIFQIAARQFGVDPSTTVYIDDLEKNVASARAIGFHAFQYDHAAHGALLAWLDEVL